MPIPGNRDHQHDLRSSLADETEIDAAHAALACYARLPFSMEALETRATQISSLTAMFLFNMLRHKSLQRTRMPPTATARLNWQTNRAADMCVQNTQNIVIF